MARARTTTEQSKPKRRSGASVFFRGFMLGIDVLAVCALIVSAYSGNVSPLKHGGYWGILPLCFGPCLLVTVLLLLLHLFWLRKGAVITGLGILICTGPLLGYCPLNFTTPKVPEGAETLTVLTYNTHQFLRPHTTSNPPGTDNEALNYIIDTDADIVCLQEATYVGTIAPGILTPAQVNRLHECYPHVHTDCEELVVMSKYPLEAIHLETNNRNFNGGLVSCYRVTLPSGRLITLFNVHLQSMQLSDSDKSVYIGLTKGKREGLGSIKNQLLYKISNAAVNRARQIQQLMRYIRLYGGPDVIVAGDFNDVSGCYSLRTLADAGFRSVYSEVGLGPMITYNDSRLLFCLDHIMYRGALKPVSLHKGTLRASDHYPLTALFYIESAPSAEE